MTSIRSRIARLFADDDVLAISRRYFVSNGFDGTLTSIGIVVGAVLTGVSDGSTVIAIGVGAAVGLGTSALWSVWEIERAETLVERARLERAMLTSLEGTHVHRTQRRARVVHALSSGLGPVIGTLVPVTPFVFTESVLTMRDAATVGVLAGIGVLGLFGAYMGAISGQRWYIAAARMGLAGLVVALINVALPG